MTVDIHVVFEKHISTTDYIRPISYGRLKRMHKKGSTNEIFILFYFKQISMFDACFYVHFSRGFQKYSF